ncbi:hypothetical protein [Sulfitobacter sp. NFXS29]
MLLADGPMKVLNLFLGMMFEQIGFKRYFSAQFRKLALHRRPKLHD